MARKEKQQHTGKLVLQRNGDRAATGGVSAEPMRADIFSFHPARPSDLFDVSKRKWGCNRSPAAKRPDRNAVPGEEDIAPEFSAFLLSQSVIYFIC